MTADDEIRQALDLLSSDPDEPEEWWPAEAGDQLAGRVETVHNGHDEKYNRPAVQVVLRDLDGQLRSWTTSQAVPIRAFERRSLRPGDVLAVEFKGKREAANGGREYADYSIKVMREGRPVRAVEGIQANPPAIEGSVVDVEPVDEDETEPPPF